MKFDDIGWGLPQECLRAALLVSLLSVWVLVGLFHYLNRYTRTDSFRIWKAAWLFYALWLTLSFGVGDAASGRVLFTVNQFCVSISAALLLWGSMRLLGLPVPQKLSVVFGIFLAGWIVMSPQFVNDPLQVHLPVFILLGLSSPFAGVCFLRLQRQKEFVGVGMLSLGFLLWVIYIGNYPFARQHGYLYSAGFFVAAALQLVIAASMILCLVQEVEREAEQVRVEMEAIREEQSKVNTTKEACLTLFNRLRAAEESGKAVAQLDRARRAVLEREHLQALGKMAGDVAHDINNALTPITAYSEMLLTTLPDLPDVTRQRLQRISQAAEGVAQIVANMRAFYRPEAESETSEKLSTPVESVVAAATVNSAETCRPLRILCIDDEPQLRQVMHDVLELERHQVTVATGGKEGLEIFRSSLRSGEPYEVVITDLGMPEIDGNHVARTIKTESPRTPIIMMTGWGTRMKADGDVPAVDAILGKPPRMQELNELLFQVTAKAASAA